MHRGALGRPDVFVAGSDAQASATPGLPVESRRSSA